MNTITLSEAQDLLSQCNRVELRDHYFGDKELTWYDSEGQEVATGYCGHDFEVVIDYEDKYYLSKGDEAYRLSKLGTLS